MIDAPTPRLGKVITFYSYKGGTGRSMALANIACLLATRQVTDRGRAVLAIDWDLEAPGLHRYFEPYLRKDDAGPGLIELFLDVRDRLADVLADKRDDAAIELAKTLDLRKYARPTRYPKLIFMPAGDFTSDYASRVNGFSWPTFFADAPSFIRHLAHRLAQEFSYVLIDSRTGVTDITGICTMLMPEQLVVVFTPNRQSLTGITDLVKRATDYRRGSDDLRPLVVFPLPSRIDTSFPDLMKRWRDGDASLKIVGWQTQFMKLLGDVYALDKDDLKRLEEYFDRVQLAHVAQYAYGEPLVLDERSSDKLTLLNSYSTLRDYLMRGGSWVKRSDASSTDVLEKKIADLEGLLVNAALSSEPRKAAALNAASKKVLKQRVTNRRVTALLMSIAVAVGVYGSVRFWIEQERKFASSRLLAKVVQSDQELAPDTTSLLLLEALPDLKPSEHDSAVSRLKKALSMVPPTVLQWRGSEVRRTAFSRDGKQIVIYSPTSIALWDAIGGKKLDEHPASTIVQAAFYADTPGAYLALDRKELTVWQGGKKLAHALLPNPDLPGAEYRLSPNGRYLARVSDKVYFWRVADLLAGSSTPFLTHLEKGGLAFDSVLEFENDDDTVAIWTNKGMTVWDLLASKPVALKTGGPYLSVHLSADGLVVATALPGRIVFHHSKDGAPFAELHVPDLTNFAFQSGGSPVVVAVLPDGVLRSYELPTGTATGILLMKLGDNLTLGDPGDSVSTAVCTLDDQRFYVRGVTDVAVVPNALGSVQYRIRQRAPISGVMNSSNRMAIITSNSVTVYDVGQQPPAVEAADDKALARFTCGRIGHPLTKEEWATYLPERDYAPKCAPTKAVPAK